MTNQTEKTFPESIAELLRLAERATKGPWSKYDWASVNERRFVGVTHSSGDICALPNEFDCSERPVEETTANADFIAFARNFAEQWKDKLQEIADGKN